MYVGVWANLESTPPPMSGAELRHACPVASVSCACYLPALPCARTSRKSSRSRRIRLARRIKRDIASRGREIDGILQQYEQFVQPHVEMAVFVVAQPLTSGTPEEAPGQVACSQRICGCL